MNRSFALSLVVTRKKTRRRWRRRAWYLFLQQGALAFGERRERLVARNRADQLVEVPGGLGFRRLLDLEQIGRMDGAAVGLNLALAEQRIVGRHRLHLFHHLVPLCGLPR